MDARVINYIEKLEPWKRLPIEIFFHAVSARREGAESNKRIAFILLDNAVELSLKTYLEKRGKKFADDVGFHTLLASLSSLDPKHKIDLELDDLRRFRELRNILFHNAIGLAPDESTLEMFEGLAKNLINTLLKTDIDTETSRTINIENANIDELEIARVWDIFGDIDSEFQKPNVTWIEE
jgi:hypothetical protein